MSESPEQVLDDEHGKPQEPESVRPVIWSYWGPGSRTYPGRRDPETGGVLNVEPGDAFDFGEEMPPDDGLWYAVPSDSSPASTGAGETKE